jgi:hypothetical protein
VNLIPRDIASQQAFDARKPRLLAAAALAAAAPFCVWLALASSEGWNKQQIAEVVNRQNELTARRIAIEASRKQAVELAAKCKELEFVVLNRSNWPAFLGDLQARVGTCKNTWIEEMHVKYETVPPAPVPEGQTPPPPQVVTKVILSVRFLFSDVPYDVKQYRSASEKAHISRLLEAVRKSPYVSAVPENEISVTEQNTIRNPKATITLVIQKDKAL